MQNASEVRLAPFGRIMVAAVGASAPTDVSGDFSVEWTELGYVTEDGVTMTPTLTTEDHKVWQSLVPVKTSATDLTYEVNFQLAQWNEATTSLFFFGAEWAEVTEGVSQLEVPSSMNLAENALAVEWTDDEGSVNRLVVPRGFVSDREAIQLQRSSMTTLGVTFKALDNSGEFFYILSNNPALQPTSP